MVKNPDTAASPFSDDSTTGATGFSHRPGAGTARAPPSSRLITPRPPPAPAPSGPRAGGRPRSPSMTTRSWVRKLFARTPRSTRQAPARFRQQVEALEDRSVPALIAPGIEADDV